MAAGAAGGCAGGWRALGVTRRELCLAHTLPVGQTFRWRPGPRQGAFRGVVGRRIFELEQMEGEEDVRFRVLNPGEAASAREGSAEASLRDYFTLGKDLGALSAHWSAQDRRFAALQGYFPGCRLLRQDPLECLFSFILSSNNHISRIQSMVDALCAYGDRLGAGAQALEDGDGAFYAFPSLEQMAQASEADLRSKGFGYRAKFVTEAVAQLRAQPGGGAAWLEGLRTDVELDDARQQLTTLCGVGPKVASCVCLFSLDKYGAIPVDTHVWDLAVNYYKPELKEAKSLTPRVMAQVEEAFAETFGDHCGWAHNTLFVAELANFQKQLPEKLRTPPRARKKTPKKEKAPKAEGIEGSGGRGKQTGDTRGRGTQGGGAPKRARKRKIKLEDTD